jgi:S-sulfo-L-cysteine synthase (O-acetyl-L-serine-dependent)
MTANPATWKGIRAMDTCARYVGNTPLLPISKLFSKKGVNLFAKAEWMQMGGSVKSRPAYRIIREALKRGDLNPGKILLDASSGNTGIAYATFAQQAGIPFTICLPENASSERKDLLRKLKAEIIFTSKFESTDGAQAVARELAESHPGKYFYADQYNNADNYLAHFHGTAAEILAQTNRQLSHFICGLGTTGTFTGTASRLKVELPGIQVVSLQPDSALHGLEGWKHLETARIPGIYDAGLADRSEEVDTIVAYEMIKDASRYEGLLLSPSSAANLAGAIALAEKMDEGTVVTILPDNADRYGEVINQLFGASNGTIR